MEEIFAKALRAGIRLELVNDDLRVVAPPGAMTDEIRQGLRAHKQQIVELLKVKARPEQVLEPLTPDLAARWEPFPLTDLQHAFWLGRDSALEMGGVATHLYVELDCPALDVVRLEDALERLVARHGMLRAVVDGGGMQRILPEVPRYRIAVEDRSSSSPEEAELTVLATRSALSHQVLATDRWPLFEIRATMLPGARTRLHISLDLLVLDAWSIFLFFQEWHRGYEDLARIGPPLDISFRDYVLADRQRRRSPAYERALAYWMARIDELPPAPELPLRSDLTSRQSPRYTRRELRLDAARWSALKARAREEGLTPSGLVLAAYSEVLARWSASPHFTLNLTVSNRLQVHESINEMLGDFTSVLMQEVDRRDAGLSFVEFARRLQKQFGQDLDHREVSGLLVLREWAKRRGRSPHAAMPVVFSSGLIWSGDQDVGNLEQLGKKVWSVSQTSQVWLDHHVLELEGELSLIWDAADRVFEDGVLDAMFAAYRDLVERLADDPATWTSRDVVRLPAEVQRQRIEANATERPLVRRRMHEGFVARALEQPSEPAVIASDRTITYGELLSAGAAVADSLLGAGLQPGQLVAVAMHKGWEQVVAVLGVLLARGAYLPVDADLPIKRQEDLLRIGEVQHVLTQPGVPRTAFAGRELHVLDIEPSLRGEYGEAHARSLHGPLDQLAYVIFTSGTTGVPKGVMIDHGAAMNTIAHVNEMFGVSAADRVLAVSSLSFDLSVYDIFGLLDVGGALVIPDHAKGHDAVHWRELARRHGVTVWNSAPQLMRMVMDSFQRDDEPVAPLRVVLLSGDFIPLDLPDHVRRVFRGAEVVSLGGATEASIWSNYHRIGTVSPAWTSIPYGKALPNQTIWVYDHALRPCPAHVRGRIFLGGLGLAQGYLRDPEKTAARFITHPATGARLYDTGDLGKYAPDGNVVILGRDDGQVKIRGHRVELGEIEAVLRQHPGIEEAVVLALRGAGESRELVAYLVLRSGTAPDAVDDAADPEVVMQHVAARLPDYMIPRHVIHLDEIPVTANGKIDHNALILLSEEQLSASHERVAPRTDLERTIHAAWSRVIVDCEIGVTDNFFDLGGDSVLATQLVREINAVLPFELEMHELFENLSIESLAQLFVARGGGAGVARSSGRGLVVDRVTLLADVEAIAGSLDALPPPPATSIDAHDPGAVLLTGATGWIGAYVLAELLSSTRATVHCLVRASDREHGLARLLDNLRFYGLELAPEQIARIAPICGDLTAPQLGLAPSVWEGLTRDVAAIYHLGAEINVLADYATLRRVNVDPLTELLRLATTSRLKPISFTSPMAVCTRHVEGRLVILTEEREHPEPEGLLTGYSQSKWVAEQVLSSARRRGVPVRVFRASHALPAARDGRPSRASYTYESVLEVAAGLSVIPQWSDSGLHGVPVDVLARVLVEASLRTDGHGGVVHVENHDPLSMQEIITLLLESRQGEGPRPTLVSREEWKSLCLEHAERMPDADATLAKMLFAARAEGTGVETMFGVRDVDTSYVSSWSGPARLSGLTPPEYWRRVFHGPAWAQSQEQPR